MKYLPSVTSLRCLSRARNKTMKPQQTTDGNLTFTPRFHPITQHSAPFIPRHRACTGTLFVRLCRVQCARDPTAAAAPSGPVFQRNYRPPAAAAAAAPVRVSIRPPPPPPAMNVGLSRCGGRRLRQRATFRLTYGRRRTFRVRTGGIVPQDGVINGARQLRASYVATDADDVLGRTHHRNEPAAGL